MRLLSVHVQNYRTHRDCTADFANDLTLIQGPNESGKSTLVEAIHRTLFLKAKGTSEVHRVMESRHGGKPTVTLTFEAHGKVHTLTKHFTGNNATTTLETQGEATLNGDAAEEALARLLGVEEAIQGRGAANAINLRWAHLWVWQGASNHSPLEAAREAQSDLRHRLQDQAGEGPSSSQTDTQLIQRLQQLHDDTYTKSGQPKTGSDLKRTEDALAKARLTATQKRETLTTLESAASRFTQAESDISRHSTTAAQARKELQLVTEKLQKVETHKRTLRDKQQLTEQAQADLKTLQDADRAIRTLENQLEEAQKQAKPQEQRITTLTLETRTSTERLNKATDAREKASRQTQTARARLEAWQAHANLLKATQQLKRLETIAKKISDLKKKQQEAKANVAKHEAFSARAIKALRKKHQAATTAKAQLEAHALRLEVLTADTPIQIGDDPAETGSNLTLTESTEIQIGDGTRLRLTPGASSDLDAARDEATAAETAYQQALHKLGVQDIESAEQRELELSKYEGNLASIQTELDTLDSDQVEGDLEETRQEIARHQTLRDRPVDGLSSSDFSEDLPHTERELRQAETALTSATDTERESNSTEKALRKKAEKLAADLEEQKAAHSESSDNLKTLRNRLDFQREQWGEQTARSQKLVEAQAKLDQARAAQDAEQKTLDALGPADLELDQKRLQKTIENSETLLQTARDSRASSLALLQNNGTTDPESELKEAEAECERLEQNLSRLTRQATARKYLLEHLHTAQSRITSALAAPLEAAAAPYLESLFGPGSKARLEWAPDGSGLTGLSIDRSHLQNGTFPFEQLSHGTREQVALALRLAMAEVLSADHDGTLPLILDDAFTHADKDRIQKLQRLLYRAADRGLQIILLSCHPENYSGLTSNEVSLS